MLLWGLVREKFDTTFNSLEAHLLNFETEAYFYIKMNHATEHNEMIIKSII